MNLAPTCFTFDIEPVWCDIPVKHNRSAWVSRPDDTEVAFYEVISFLKTRGIRACFFIVGKYAEQFPERVKLIQEEGHEIGSHSHWHEDCSLMSLHEFKNDVKKSINTIEKITGTTVSLFRAPSFSIRLDQLSALADLGIKIDSSICLGGRIYGGGEPSSIRKYQELNVNCFREVPILSNRILGRELVLMGGGYLRVLPQFLIPKLMRQNKYNMIYLHLHDFIKDVPFYGSENFLQRMRKNSYTGNMYEKLELILQNSNNIFNLTELNEYLKESH